MPKTDGRKLYDPQLDPERKIIREKLELLESIIGTNRCVRSGEQYLVSCQCGSFIVTSESVEVGQFQQRHHAHVDDKININDIEVTVFRPASHAGGQTVGVPDSLVKLTHLPSGLSVTCGEERSQLQNKAAAMWKLKEMLREHGAVPE
jgi:hypothetical protein